MATRRARDIRGQMQLPFGQKPKKAEKTAKRALQIKNLILPEKRAVKGRAFALATRAYAILSSPGFRGNPHYASYRREIGQFIGLCKKNKATYLQAQSKTGMITGLFDRLGVKYKP